jgi:hypothetical protein
MYPAGTSLTARTTLLVRDGLSASDDSGNTRTNLDLDIDQSIVFMQEDFCGGGGATPNIGQYGWQLGGGGSGQYGPGNFGTAFPNICLFRLDSSGTASTFAALGNPNISFGALGNAASWNAKFTFKLEQTTNTRSAVGFFLADANTKTLTATDWFGLRYDTNAGTADASFKFTTCKASACTTHGPRSARSIPASTRSASTRTPPARSTPFWIAVQMCASTPAVPVAALLRPTYLPRK